MPFAIADATALTEAGYVGEDVENILLKLIQAADFDVKKAETGIIYIDEVDKIARKADNPSITRDVSRRGRPAGAPEDPRGHGRVVPPQGGRKHPHQEFLSIDTTNILFICGGAFADLDKIIERRIGRNSIGFGAELRSRKNGPPKDLFPQVMPEDLISYGLIPEFIGRLPVVSAVHAARPRGPDPILLEPKNALIKQYQRFFNLRLDRARVHRGRAGCDRPPARSSGQPALAACGRSSRSALLNVMFDLPSRKDVNKCVVTARDDREAPRSDPRHRGRPGRGRHRRAARRVGVATQ